MCEKLIDTMKSLFQELQLTELEVKEGDFSLHMKKEERLHRSAFHDGNGSIWVQDIPEAVRGCCSMRIINCNEVKAPLVGVFYAAPSPDAKPFVNVGDVVKKGDVLCIVEAMKMMNEIVSDFDGKIIDICAENGKIVEFGQTLFKISED